MGGRLAGSVAELRSALTDRRLRRVQLAWSGTITAEWAIIVALGVWAFAAGGPLGVGLLTLVRTFPAALIGPFLAPIADRYRRDRVVAVVTMLRVLLSAGAAAVLLGDGPAALVYVLAALDAVVYSLYWPAQSSLLAELARTPDQLVAANVASTTIENVGGLGGPAVAAIVLGLASPGATVAVASAMLLGSVLTLVPIVREGRETARPDDDDAVGDPLAGFRHLARTPQPRLVAGLYLSHTLALGGLTVLVVVLALDRLGLGDAGVGVLTAGMGLGGIAGSLGAIGLVGHPRLARALATGVLVWAVATALLGITLLVSVAFALLAAAGASNAVVDVAALTLLQRLVPPRLLGRVLGVVEGAWWATLGAGGFLASVLASRLGVDLALAVIGAALAVLAVALQRSIRRIDAAVTVPRELLDALLRDPILGPLPPRELERIAQTATPVVAEPGDEIVRIGEVGERYYVIRTGAVEVTRAGVRRRLEPGDGFGEVALLRDVPRTATVTALETTQLLAVDRSPFLAAVRGHQHSAAAAAVLVNERFDPDRTGTR